MIASAHETLGLLRDAETTTSREKFSEKKTSHKSFEDYTIAPSTLDIHKCKKDTFLLSLRTLMTEHRESQAWKP